jgi:hypothetical protein
LIFELAASTQEFTVWSADDKSKVPIGMFIVNQHCRLTGFYPKQDMPQTPDHTFPVGSSMLITVGGFMQCVVPDNGTVEDSLHRKHFKKPTLGPLHMFTRSFKYEHVSPQTHANDCLVASILEWLRIRIKPTVLIVAPVAIMPPVPIVAPVAIMPPVPVIAPVVVVPPVPVVAPVAIMPPVSSPPLAKDINIANVRSCTAVHV